VALVVGTPLGKLLGQILQRHRVGGRHDVMASASLYWTLYFFLLCSRCSKLWACLAGQSATRLKVHKKKKKKKKVNSH
jgi:hypothetical protein